MTEEKTEQDETKRRAVALSARNGRIERQKGDHDPSPVNIFETGIWSV